MHINWTAISAIGSILASIATFLAVIVALFQANLLRRKSIKLLLNKFYEFDGVSEIGDQISILLVNNGNCSIKIEEICFYVENKFAFFFGNDELRSQSCKLPIIIDSNNSVKFIASASNIYKIYKNAIEHKEVRERDFVKIYITDDTGYRKIYNTKITIKDFIKPMHEK